jgi:ABC-type glycerol-3-phosphate transport system substrate-binding protein
VADGSRRQPIVMPGGSRGRETTAYCLIAWLASNGAQVLGPEGVTLFSAGTVAALSFLRSLLDEGLLPPDVVAYEWNRPIRLLAEGAAAVSFGGSYEGRALTELLGLRLDDLWSHVGFVPVPAGPNGAAASVAGTMSHAVFRQSAQPLEAARLIKRVVAPDSLAPVALATGRIPSRRSAVALAAPRSPFLAQTAEILQHAVIRPSTPLYPRVSDQLGAMLEAVLTGRLDPAGAAHRAAEMIGAITGLPLVAEGETAPVAPVLATPAR